ncbi:MAG: hypothetical protein R3C24_05695 [Cyanobacteriota/Melainabacteria group bacterium]
MTKSTEGGPVDTGCGGISQTSESGQSKVSLKDFLSLLTILTDQRLQTAFEKSVNNQILGRILLSAGLLDENSLQAAMRLVFWSGQGDKPGPTHRKPFNFAFQNKVSIDEAWLDWTSKSNRIPTPALT